VVYETFCKNLFEKTTKAICSGLKESIGIIKFKIGDLEMASSKDYLQFVLEQLSELQEITYRAMMGEFIIYYRGKIVGGIYDDRLLVKPTKSAISYMPTVTYEIPYENAKEMLLVEEVDNKDFLTGLFDVMYDELPTPKPKKKNKQLLVYNFISIYTKQLVLGLTAF
jgi:Regulator of competence-specific genes